MVLLFIYYMLWCELCLRYGNIVSFPSELSRTFLGECLLLLFLSFILLRFVLDCLRLEYDGRLNMFSFSDSMALSIGPLALSIGTRVLSKSIDLELDSCDCWKTYRGKIASYSARANTVSPFFLFFLEIIQ
jgi:hypothetical protein